jgi:WD40 repeat protein
MTSMKPTAILATTAKSPNGSWEAIGEAATRGDRGFVHVRSLTAATAVKDLDFHFLGPSYLAFTADGAALIAIGGNSRQGEIRVWRTADWEELHREALDSEPNSVAMSPDGSTLLTGGYAGNLRFRDAHTGKTVQTIDTCPKGCK